MPLEVVSSITINTGENPENYVGFEQEVAAAIEAMDKARMSQAADLALEQLVSLHGRGVLFPSRLMFLIARNPAWRTPSEEALFLLPGARVLYDSIHDNWHMFRNERNKSVITYFKRVIINLYLCSELKNLIDMDPNIFTTIARSWKDEQGFWQEMVLFNANSTPVLNMVARAYSRLQSLPSYTNATRQPRTGVGGGRGRDHDRSAREPQFVLNNPTPENQEWVSLFSEWLNGLHIKQTGKHKLGFCAFLDWVKLYPADIARSPMKLLAAYRNTPSILEFMKGDSKHLLVHRGYQLSLMFNFTEWVIDRYLLDTDGAEGAVRLGNSILSYSDQRELDGIWASTGGRTDTSSKPLPTRWRIKLAEILTENNFEWPKSLTNQYFEWRNESGGIELIWVPTLTFLYLTMLELPLRRIQVLCLDSGEGDSLVYDPRNRQWVENTGTAAGHWDREPGAKVKQRGVLKPMGTLEKPFVGFHVNTNKTADRNAKSPEHTGYDIPWENEKVIDLFTELRRWQERYNPAATPTPYSAVGVTIFGDEPTERVIKETPDRFYLFRSPLSARGDSPQLPPTYNQCLRFWCEAMAKLEQVLREEGEDVTIIQRWNKGQPESPYYNIHGLRVATLTAFAEAGVPIEVLSKLVAGHSTILMTLYYLKFNEASISELLSEKALEIRGNAADQMRRHLENKAWDEAKRIAAYNDEEMFREAVTKQLSPLCSNEGYGICPHGGTRCHDGGPLEKGGKNPKDRIYGHVRGGSHNCLRCRHFITGEPFLIQLWMKSNKLLADAQKMATEYDAMNTEIESLEDMQFRRPSEFDGRKKSRLRQLQGLSDLRHDALNDILIDLHSAWRLIEQIKTIIERDDGAGNLALVASPDALIQPSFRETTRFELLSHVLQASRIYPFLEDESLEMERERFLDVVLMREHLMPLCMMPLPPEAKRRAADAASRFLLTKIGAQEAQQVFEGKINLRQLGIEQSLLPKVIEEGAAQVPILNGAQPKVIGSDIHHG